MNIRNSITTNQGKNCPKNEQILKIFTLFTCFYKIKAKQKIAINPYHNTIENTMHKKFKKQVKLTFFEGFSDHANPINPCNPRISRIKIGWID